MLTLWWQLSMPLSIILLYIFATLSWDFDNKMFIYGSFFSCHPQRYLKETFDSQKFIYIFLDDERPKFYFYVLAISVEPSELLFLIANLINCRWRIKGDLNRRSWNYYVRYGPSCTFLIGLVLLFFNFLCLSHSILFSDSIISDLFTRVVSLSPDHSILNVSIREIIQKMNLQLVPWFIGSFVR